MLQTMRSGAGGFLAKLLLGLLVLSFVLWGIGDAIRNVGNDTTVASVGKVKISQNQLSQQMQRKVEQIRQQMGKNFNPDILKGLDLVQLTLNNMIEEILLDKEARAQGILVGDAAVQDMIGSNPVFQTDGKFDLQRFQMLLKGSRINEQQYYNELRKNTATQLLVSALAGPAAYPEPLIPILTAWQKEQRSADVMTIDKNSLHIASPSADDLAAYYDKNKNNYMVTEYRTLSYALIDFAKIVKDTTVAADDLKSAYDTRSASLRKPETRDVEQLLYDSEEKANQASHLLAGGKVFSAVAKQVAPTNAGNLTIKEVDKTKLPKEAAEKIFAMKENDVSPVIKTDFGWHIFRVSKIHPEHTPTLEELRPALEKELRQRAAEDSIGRIVNQVEDALASGAKLADAAKTAGATIDTVGPISKSGEKSDGKKAVGLTATRAFLETAFATDSGTESQAVPTDDGSYFILRVENITPERAHTLSEVKPELTKAWGAEKQREQMIALASKAINDLKKGTPFGTVASSVGASIKHTGFISRRETSLPAELLEDIFKRNKGESTHPHATPTGGVTIANVTGINTVKVDAKSVADSTMNENLTRVYHEEIYQQFMAYLRNKYGVTVHPERLPKPNEAEQAE